MRILLTGGGTGGHIYPLLAVAEELKRISREEKIVIDLRYFGDPGPFREILEKEGIGVSKILGSKLRRYFDFRNFLDIPNFFLSFFQLLWKILIFMPDVLFSKGGPGALPVVLVSRFYRVPIIIHESDAVPGFTNRISSYYAKRIGISFLSARDYFMIRQAREESGEIALTGNPLRPSFLARVNRTPIAQPLGEIRELNSKEMLGLVKDKPLIIFMGGSQGATRINDFVLDVLPELVKNYQLILQTGIQNFEEVKKEFDVVAYHLTNEERKRYLLTGEFRENFEDQLVSLADSLIAADLVVSRTGSGAIFSIAAFGKPSILIPLPEAANDHQRQNAYEYAKTGAAVVIETDNLSPNIFLDQVKRLLTDPEKLKAMSEAAKQFAKPEAATVIAEEILKLGSS